MTLFDVDPIGAPIAADLPGRARHDAPETSKRAATAVRAGSQALALLAHVVAAGASGLTADEAEPLMSSGRPSPMSPNQVGSRMGDLRTRHLVDHLADATGEPVTRRTRRGADANVFVATAAGLAELSRHDPEALIPKTPGSRTPLARRPDVAEWLESRQTKDWPRRTGLSSDALVAYALGTGERPSTPGNPDGYRRWSGDERGSNYPADKSDLLACVLTYESAPADLRAVMAPVMDEFRAWVLHSVNRHGVVVT